MDKALQDRLAAVFMPTALGRINSLIDANRRLVYYTSAEVALEIIRNREWWLRDASCMNDYSEVKHGLRCLIAAYNSDAGQELKNALNNIHPKISAKIETHLDAGISHLVSRTYITCLSEHFDRENDYGRLSMWRAYGGKSGVALVLNIAPLLSTSNVLNAFSIPVSYWFQEHFESELRTIAANVRANTEDVRTLGEEQLALTMFNTLRFLAICAKHPGFREECEWRVVYSPTIQKSEVLQPHQTTVNEIPQTIYKLPSADIPEEGLTGIEIPDLIDRVIIGPTQFPSTISEAMQTALSDAGVVNPEYKVIASDIPLRQ